MNFNLDLSTPALLFSAISLLLLAYTNRFLAYASLVRELSANYQKTKDKLIKGQIQILKKRLTLIRIMQFSGVSSLLLCVFCMLLIYIKVMLIAEVLFVFALLLLIVSLSLTIWEVNISVKALDLHLANLKEDD